jgi:hypothetical protein
MSKELNKYSLEELLTVRECPRCGEMCKEKDFSDLQHVKQSYPDSWFVTIADECNTCWKDFVEGPTQVIEKTLKLSQEEEIVENE